MLVVVIFFAAVALFVGIGLLPDLLASRATVKARAGWPSVPGAVDKVTWMKQYRGVAPSGGPAEDGGIHFSYQPPGSATVLKGRTKLRFASRADVDLCAQRLTGQQVRVYYNPRSPAKALLLPEDVYAQTGLRQG